MAFATSGAAIFTYYHVASSSRAKQNDIRDALKQKPDYKDMSHSRLVALVRGKITIWNQKKSCLDGIKTHPFGTNICGECQNYNHLQDPCNMHLLLANTG